MVSLLRAWYSLTAAVAPSPEAYNAGRALHRAAMIPPMPKQHQQQTAAATGSLKPEPSGHSHHRAELMTPTRRRVSVNQSILPESNENSLRREEKMSPTRRRVLVKQSIPEATNSMIMSMKTSEKSTPMVPSEMSMPTGTIEMSMPIELSEMSIPKGMIEMSMPIVTSEMSMSMGIEKSMPILMMSEMSMSMGMSEMSMPIELSEMSMPTGMIDMSMPIELSEMSMSIGTSEMSTPMELSESMVHNDEVSASPTSRPTRHIQTSVPTSSEPSASPTYNPSTPWPSYVPTSGLNALGESSLSIVLDPTILPSSSPATKIPTTKTPTVLPSKLPTLLPSKLPTKSPTQSPITNTPTTSSPVATVAPTRSHSASPLPGVISVETITQLQLIGMYVKMDVKASDIFKQSCISFLEEYLAEAQPPTFTVNCEVTKQQLLSGRRLRAKRGLEGESSLLVDVSVKGNANATKSAMEASNIHFNDQVIETFAMHSSEFVEQLQEDGIEAGVHAFDRLTSTLVYPTGGDVSEIVESPDGSEDSESNGSMSQNLAIATMTVSGIVILGMFAFIFYRMQNNESINDGSSISESSSAIEVNDVMIPVGSIYSADQTETRPDVTPVHAGDITYKYSLEDGLASPESILSKKPFSPLNLLDWMKGEEPLSSNRKKVNMLAPPGKLGIIIDTCSEGPIVHNIKDGSALEGLIFKGDLIVAVDDEDTTEWSAHYLTKLVAKKSNLTRKITVLRTDMN